MDRSVDHSTEPAIVRPRPQAARPWPRRAGVLVAAALLAALAAFPAAGVAANQRPFQSPASVEAWNEIARVATASTSPPMYQIQGLIYIALTQAAVYDAVVAIDGGYVPYRLHLGRHRGASLDAAVATAAHDILAHYFPGQAATFDAALASTAAGGLGGVPAGPARDEGIAVGAAAAAGIIALRQGDGLEADIGFTMPAPGPGVWQGPLALAGHPDEPQTPWVGQLRPFMLRAPDQFLPAPPPALSSAAWASEFNETRLYGSATSTLRTPDQTLIAQFWSSNAPRQYNTAFRSIVDGRGLDALQAARLFAMGNMVGADAGIACMNAKYDFLFWRPITAVHQADTDGNPGTVADPAWAPLLATPNHPEYPAAHGCVTGAEADVLAAFLGTQRIDVDFTSTITPTMPTRHFVTARDLQQEVVNARVWGGLHFRGSAEAGVALGHNVVRFDLARNFKPAD